MAPVLHAIPSLRSSAAAQRRFGLALCVSALIHAWFVIPLLSTPQPQFRPSFTLNARIEAVAASLDPPVESMPVLEAVPPAAVGKPESSQAPLAAHEPRASRKSSPIPFAAPMATAPQKAIPEPAPQRIPLREREAWVLPPPVDATWYAAHELDSYPRALAPIRLEHSRLGGSVNAGDRLLVWLRIDERGEVVDVSAGETATPGHWLDAARASLATVRFTPARKDERAVRSRLLLSIDFAGPSER